MRLRQRGAVSKEIQQQVRDGDSLGEEERGSHEGQDGHKCIQRLEIRELQEKRKCSPSGV